ncbi:hypothetical protein ES706_05269 [subsurface metagenome]
MKLELELVGSSVFVGPRWQDIKLNKNLLFVWITETSAPNIIYWRSITLTWHWPFIRWVVCFTETDE